MKFSCDQCQAQYMIADEKVGPKGVKVRCKKCGNIISVQRDAAAADAPTQVSQQPAAQGSAFDDLFGQNGGGGGADEEERAPTKVFTTQELDKVRQEQALAKGTDAPAGDSFASQFGGSDASKSEAAPAAAPMAKAEWYVAINDEQVGPIGDPELTQRWERGDLTAASLAWKAGMPDWQPIASIAELQHITSKEQKSQQKAAAPISQPQPEAPVEEKKEVVTWRPSGASALADLAKEAVVEEPKRPEPQPDASPFGPDFNPQPAGGGDPFNQPAFAGAGGPSTVWQFPSTTSKKSSSGVPKWLLIAASFIGVALLGGIGVLAYAVINPRPPVYQQPPPQNPQTPPVAQNPPPTTPPGTPPGTPPTTPPTAQNTPPPTTPPATPPPTTPPVAGKGEKPAKGLKGKNKGEKTDGTSESPPVAAKETKPPKEDSGGFDDLLGGKKKNTEVKATLSRDDVLGTVKSNAGAITKCAEAYSRGGGKLPAKLVARWVIKPSGFTDSQEMASPELKGTPVDACVVAAIKKWKFPEFQSGTIPVTFPFAVAQ